MKPKETHIYFDNIVAKVDSSDPEMKHVLYDLMKIRPKGYMFSPLYKKRIWDGWYRFFKGDSYLETGNLSWALNILREYHKDPRDKITIHDIRRKPKLAPRPHSIDLYDYQRESVDLMFKCTRGMINAATGAGKTEIAIAFMAEAGVKTLFLVNSQDLLNQTVTRILAGIPSASVRQIGSGKDIVKKNPEAPDEPWIVVSTIQTLSTRDKLLKELVKWQPALKISDEAHGVAAKTWKKVFQAFSSYYTFGFSGSFDAEFEDPLRYTTIVGSIGRPIVIIPPGWLIERGRLAKPIITCVLYSPKREVRKRDFDLEYDLSITEDPVLNEEVIPRILAMHRDKQTLILVNKIEHGTYLSKVLKVPFLSGKDAIDHRMKVTEAFKKGRQRVLIASKIFTQGIDIPGIEVVIIASCDKSYKLVFQKLGRGLRKTDEKDTLLLYDIWPKTGSFLDVTSSDRMKKYKYLGFDVCLLPINKLRNR